VTPPHSATFRRHLLPVRLHLVRHPLRVELLASLLAFCRAVARWLACVSACAWGGGCGGAVRTELCAGLRMHAALPSRSQAAGRALARLQSCAPSPGSCLSFALACVGLVLSRCVALVS
jgi:hypothetical protein